MSIVFSFGREFLSPIQNPYTHVIIEEAEELDDDFYSNDLSLFSEIAFSKNISLYSFVSYRFASYSYEYSTKGYIHNYCNLHVNGFNESYFGTKKMILPFLGLDFNIRFPPGEGSDKERFYRFNFEPFFSKFITDKLFLGFSVRYNTFLEDSNFEPGDEFGIKGSFFWNILWNKQKNTGFIFSETILFQRRFQESENHNLEKKCSKMNDKYNGIKFSFSLSKKWQINEFPFKLGINYQINKGTLFGFETGHRIGIFLDVF